ncbi:MAG: SURF1 family protein [Phyllobacteriaceae bacterium]|nr:SURF1 family protein [Phyllobacteriaceae bacterium]
MTTMAKPGRVSVLLLIFSAAAFCVLIALGTWQWQRMIWKEGLLATIEQRLAEPPVPFDAIVALNDSGQPIEYRPVSVSGRLLNEHEQFVLSTYNGLSGWHVYTPLEVAGMDGAVVFVNRGFVPYDMREPAKRAEGQMDSLINIEGLARQAPGQKPSSIVPDNDPANRTYYWKDLSAMTTAAGLDEGEVLPLFIDKTSKLPDGLLPVANVTQVDLPNNHLQYLITWYGLALALAGVVVAYVIKARRGTA